MKCPKCGNETKVIDSREVNADSVRRRRECLECGYRYTTIEEIPQPEEVPVNKAILIMDMPEGCYTCPCCSSNMYCRITYQWTGIVEGRVPEWCPIIQITGGDAVGKRNAETVPGPSARAGDE